MIAQSLLKVLFNAFNASLPQVFDYYSTRIILSLLTSLLVGIVLGPRFIAFLKCYKVGQPIRKEDCPELGELHKEKQNTPTMGGALIIFSMLTSCFLWMDFSFMQSWILLVTLIILGFLGAYDDFLKLKHKNSKGLSSKRKFAVQALFSLVLIAYFFHTPFQESLHDYLPVKQIVAKQSKGMTSLFSDEEKKVEKQLEDYPNFFKDVYLPFYKYPWISFSGWGLLLLAAFFVVVIVGSSNAVNLTDGLDGLVSGVLICTCIPLITFAFLSNNILLSSYLNLPYIEGSGEVAVFLCSMAGALLGFLWFNAPPAEIFMGDTGSLGLGGALGVSAILIRREFLLALCGGVLVLETLSVILQVLSYRYRQKKRLFLIAPLHHHFEYKGWAETKVVIRFWILSILFSLMGLASIKFQ